MGYFDDFLAKVPAEDQTVLNRYPELKASVSKMEDDLAKVSRYAGEWVGWQQQNWDAEAGMTRAEKGLRDELAAAQARIAAGTGSAADDQTVKALESKFEAKLDETNKRQLQAIEGMNLFYQTALKRSLTHQQEFKENLDPQALMGYMQQNKIADPDLAYDRMVAGKRAELATQAAKDLETKHAADITAAEQRGAEKKAQELAMGPSGMLPTDNTGGIAGVTSRIDKPATIPEAMQKQVEGAKLGDGSLATLGYEMYRRGDFQTPVQ